MQMAWSANARYGASRSASLKTATTSMPRSRQARITRKAISPRFATRMRWNIGVRGQGPGTRQQGTLLPWPLAPGPYLSGRGLYHEQRLAVLDRLLVLRQD